MMNGISYELLAILVSILIAVVGQAIFFAFKFGIIQKTLDVLEQRVADKDDTERDLIYLKSEISLVKKDIENNGRRIGYLEDSLK